MPLAAPQATFSAPGLYGKVPAQGDFVRIQASDPGARALAAWLEEGSEPVRRRGTKTGPAPVRFVFHGAGCPRVLVGVMAESRDRVGREFPLAIFVGTGLPDLREAFAAVPLAMRPFLDAAEGLLREAAGLSMEALAARLSSLPVPGAAGLGTGIADGRSLGDREPGSSMLARLFGDPAAGEPAYAVHCLRAACDPVQKQEPPVARVVLDCPARADVDRWAWMEMARRLLRWEGPPSCFWRELEPGRLLLSLGPPPASMFGVLCDEPRADSRLWPMTTTVPAAIASARKALGTALVQALEATDRSVSGLVDAVAA